MSNTTDLWEVVNTKHSRAEERGRPIFPKMLIDALRVALESGMSCEGISAAIHLMAGLDQMEKGMPPDELVCRCREISKVMVGDSTISKARRMMNKHLQESSRCKES
jgi:hypothetical protein